MHIHLQVWPGSTVFPDFTHPDAGNYWYTHAKAFHDTVQYDGMWIVSLKKIRTFSMSRVKQTKSVFLLKMIMV